MERIDYLKLFKERIQNEPNLFCDSKYIINPRGFAYDRTTKKFHPWINQEGKTIDFSIEL